MKIGYARVSTTDQDLTQQESLLSEAGCERIFKEKISGAKRDRPELEKLLTAATRPGDVLVVCKLDRLARSTSHLLDIIETLRKLDVGIQSLSEPWADTTSSAGKMVMTVFAGIAEFERDLIRERTSTGRKAARKRGVKFGRPHKLTEEQKIAIREMRLADKPISEIARLFSVNRSTIYRLSE